MTVSLLGAALLASGGGAAAAESNKVTIVTDSAGIPHISASNFESLGYGEAYAFAGDNFCTLAQDFVTVNGERSKYFGPAGLALDYSAGTDPSNLDSDLFWQSVKQSGLYQSETKAAPPIGPLPQVLQLYEGYVKGYNAYLASGRLTDPACAGKSWVRPITLEDMFLRGVQIATEASSQQFITYEAGAAPPSTGSARAAGTVEHPTTAELRALRNLGESGSSTRGSNGIAVGSKDTQNGGGLVLANPHFPWIGTERFWALQLTVPGSYNVEGGTLMGFPLVGIGFNSDIAWTHTVSTSKRFTLFQLKLVPGHPTEYYVDGKAVSMGEVQVAVNTGRVMVSHTFYTTRFGTVVDVPPAGYGWTSTTAYTMDDVDIADVWRAADQYFEMGRATSVAALLGVESRYLAIPTFNTIAADKYGHVLYGDVGNTPNVSAALIKRCLPAGLPTLVYDAAGIVTLDGATSSCAWAHARGTPVPGILPASEEPHTIRSDYVENSNDSYWLANPSAPFRAYSPIVGNIDVEQGLRTRLGNLMIAERLAGTDGLGKAKFSISTMQKMWENDRSLLAELVLKPLVAACRKSPVQKATDGKTVNLTAACKALAGYEKYENGDLDASGGWLFEVWYADAPGSGFWKVPFDVKHPLTTPYGLDTSNPKLLQALADAVQELDAHHIALSASYGQVQHVTKGHLVIPIHGCSTGCFNAIYPSRATNDPFLPGNYGEVGDGSSLVMTTALTPSGPVSQGIVTYSQATNPASPWYSNMTKLYSAKRWVHFPYTPSQLAAQPGNTAVVLTT